MKKTSLYLDPAIDSAEDQLKAVGRLFVVAVLAWVFGPRASAAFASSSECLRLFGQSAA